MKIVIPRNTVFSAEKPSPTGWYYEGVAQASELAWKALAPLAPTKFSAGTYMSLCATYICSTNKNNQYVHIEPQHGGWGALYNRDGANALIAITDGDTYNYSITFLYQNCTNLSPLTNFCRFSRDTDNCIELIAALFW